MEEKGEYPQQRMGVRKLRILGEREKKKEEEENGKEEVVGEE